MAVACALTIAACSAGSDGETSSDASPGQATASQRVDEVEPPDTAAVESTVPSDTRPEVDDPPEIPETTVPPIEIDPPDLDDPESLIWGVQRPQSFSELDPAEAFDFGTYAVLSQVVEHLTSVGLDGRPRPSLAESWTSSEAGTVWTFELRPDVTFHSGDALTADDVVWSIERGPGSRSSAVPDDFTAADVVALDDLTVQFTLQNPSTEIPLLVSDAAPQSGILRNGDIPDGGSIVGTGPFQLTRYDPDVGASFEANQDWWFASPTIKHLDFAFYDDPEGGLAALRSGEVHGVDNAPPTLLADIDDDPEFAVRSFPARNHRQIWLRTDSGTFSDVRVREAFALSIDRQALVDTLFGPYARVGNDHTIMERSPGFDASATQRTKDDEAALALLAEAGFPDGVSITMEAVEIAEVPDLAQLVATQAASAGFDITVNTQPTSTFYSDEWCPGPATDEQPCGDSAEIGIVDYDHRPTNRDFLRNPFTSDGPWNASNFTDPAFDELVTRYQNAADLDTASGVLIEIQASLRTSVPVVIPYFFDRVYAHRSNISTVSVTPLGQPRLALAEIS